MKTSISLPVSPAALSRSSRTVDAGRGATASTINQISFPSSRGAASGRVSRDGLMVRDAQRGAPPHEGSWVARGAGLRLESCALVEACDTRQEIVDLGPRTRCDAGARLALRAGRNHAALLQHIFAHRKAR